MNSPHVRNNVNNQIMSVLILICIALLTICTFVLTSAIDNKYSINEENQQVFYEDNKLTLLSSNSLTNLIPVLNWKYYDDLLMPDEINDSKHSYELITIGDYSSFNTNDNNKCFGTYRTTIYSYSEQDYISLQLYLPEILTACNIYADGILLRSLGTVSAYENLYKPYVQNQNLTITFKHSVDLVIQVCNYSHYYGGIYYPPLIADTQTMQSYITTNTVTYSLIFSIAFLVGVLCLYVFINKKDRTFLYASLLSFSFAIYIFYPIFHMIGTSAIWFMYTLENVGMIAITIFMLLLCTSLLKRNLQIRAISTVLIVCSLIAIASLTIFNFSSLVNNFFQIFSLIVRLCTALYVIVISTINVIKEDRYFLIFSAVFVFGTGLIFDIFVSSYYDPYYFLYPGDLATFITILILLVITSIYNHKTSQENKKLQNNLINEVAIRTDKMKKLIAERRDFVSSVAHDLKSPIASLDLFIKKLQTQSLTDKEKEKIYEVLDDKVRDLNVHVTTMQNFNNLDLIEDKLTKVELNSYLKNIYTQFKPEAEAEGIYLKQKISKSTKIYAVIMPNKLERAIDNILFNALSFTNEGGNIEIKLRANSKFAFIEISDDGQGMTMEVQQRVFEKFFSYRKTQQNTMFSSDGLGLYYAKLVVEECGGEISVNSQYEVGTTFTITLPLSQEK